MINGILAENPSQSWLNCQIHWYTDKSWWSGDREETRVILTLANEFSIIITLSNESENEELICLTVWPAVTFEACSNCSDMVERRVRRPRSRPHGPAVFSPGSLPPRWGEGVAPPSTPHYTVNNTPDTSPRVAMQTSPDSDQGPSNTHDTCPSTGAELLDDLHRRLMAQSVNGTLPRRPGHSRHGRKSRVPRVPRTSSTMTLPPPDLLPSSAFNHPSRHTQYSVTTDQLSPPPLSLSPPVPSSSLSYPSPPLMRTQSLSHPLTSTMLGSPESSSGGSHMSSSHGQHALGHQNSPASPEISTISRRAHDVTQYQNFENGIVYISSTQPINNNSNGANLSRFNVSPPSSTVAQPSYARTRRLRTAGKTVSWVADRKVPARNISDDRKIVKNQVFPYLDTCQRTKLI